ncbi:MAG TPA: hypothetical protein VFW50_34320, partial [Streptosporangiaceae bacterium]|nr:hypothetical protein [Streptosporangiaceae bacterium]
AATPQPPAADPVGGGFLAGGGGRIWLGGEDDATRPVIAQRAGSGWVTIRIPVTSTYGWIDAMTASVRSLWVRVEESGHAGLPGGGQHRRAASYGERGHGQAHRGGAAADQHGLTGLRSRPMVSEP